MIRWVLLKLLWMYQKVFTLFSYGSCRYYPTCSEYAKWRIEKDNLLIAFMAVVLRILRCNQLFAGGIDYPVIKKELKNVKHRKIDVRYWLVPKGGSKFILIKNFKGN